MQYPIVRFGHRNSLSVYMIYDAAVVGSGPAGTVAAHTLATAGVRVALLDQRQLPRYKTCGGGVVYRARSQLPIDISPAVNDTCYRAQINLLHCGMRFTANTEQPLVSMVMRASLDNLLVEASQSAGADIYTSHRVKAMQVEAGHVRLSTNQGNIKTRFVIAADGANSAMAKMAGWQQETRRLIPAIECEMQVNDKTLEKYAGVARFDFDIPPRGYAWVFPKRRHLSVGVAGFVKKDGARHLRRSLAEYLSVLSLKHLQMEQHGFVIPVRPRRDGLVKNRVLLVGDAAGLADPVTAEGITAAIVSGRLAAQALIASELDSVQAGEKYQASVAQELLSEIDAARYAANALYRWPALRTALFRRYGDHFTRVVADIFLGKRSYRETVRQPMNYLRMLRH